MKFTFKKTTKFTNVKIDCKHFGMLIGTRINGDKKTIFIGPFEVIPRDDGVGGRKVIFDKENKMITIKDIDVNYHFIYSMDFNNPTGRMKKFDPSSKIDKSNSDIIVE